VLRRGLLVLEGERELARRFETLFGRFMKNLALLGAARFIAVVGS
jgi:hypothetical protein